MPPEPPIPLQVEQYAPTLLFTPLRHADITSPRDISHTPALLRYRQKDIAVATAADAVCFRLLKARILP